MSGEERKTMEQIDRLFYPKSVAVIGANRVKGTVPYDIFYNILKDEFQGVVYPVSPKEPFISGVKAYKYVVDIEDEVDMAVLVFPSSVAHLAMEQCGRKGIKSMIIISAGFKEIGGVGIERERKIQEIAGRYGISFIGPNCLGVINTDPRCNFNASFARKMPDEGSIAFLSQSGALCTAVLDYAMSNHIGFSKFVSFGNKADVTEIDLLQYLKDDPKTRVILLYLEEVREGRALMKVAGDIIRETGKPVLALKSGRTREGASAAASHTGSLAGRDDICDAAFAQAGIIRCNTIKEMFDFATAFAYQQLPKSNRVAIITNAGGPGVLATDKMVSEKLNLTALSAETTGKLKKSLPAMANLKNPVDIIGDARADRYSAALEAVLKDANVDGILIILTPQSMTEIANTADEISIIAGKYDKPVYASFMGAADVSEGVQILQRRKIPHYSIPEDGCAAFAQTYRFKGTLSAPKLIPVVFKDVDKSKAHKLLNEAASAGRKYLPEAEAVNVLRAYNLPTLPGEVVQSEKEAVETAENIGFPVVMKIMSEDIVHKYDTGGVVIDIKSREEAGSAYRNILRDVGKAAPEAKIQGIYVRKMVKTGEEVIIGLKRDPSFGPVIMFGLGGLFVELFKDVSFKVAPVDEKTAAGMIEAIKSYPLLSGFRGKGESDLESLRAVIQRVSQMAVECPQIKELDINPLIVLEKGNGCFVADAKIML
jgi:acetyltransferase